MASHFQMAPLVASPIYPNCVAWSEENLLAVASGHFVTILNPALLVGPRGLVTVSSSPPFQIGLVKREDLLTPNLMPTCLSRDARPYARSISWSPQGLAPNSGCLLAVCTTEGRVKLYRAPFCDFCSEWVEVMDISEKLHAYFLSTNFGEVDVASEKLSHEQTTKGCLTDPECTNYLPNSFSKSEPRQKRGRKSSKIIEDSGATKQHSLYGGNGVFSNHDTNGSYMKTIDKSVSSCTEIAFVSCSSLKLGSSVEVFQQDSSQRFWVSGKIEHMDDGKALVVFSNATGDGNQQEEWVELDFEPVKAKEASILGGAVADQDYSSPNIRPSVNLGCLPEELLLAEHNEEVKEALRVGQPLEAWMSNRWLEGILMGFDGCGLLVKLSGENGCITLDPSSVRLAPVWNRDQQSWEVTLVKIEAKDWALPDVVEDEFSKSETKMQQKISPPNSKEKLLNRRRENDSLLLIPAGRYASHSAMLSSLVVAWSPVLNSPPKNGVNCSNNCAVLAVGGKSGKISFWRFCEPHCYTIEHGMVSVDAMLIGLLQAHNSWITAISWGISSVDVSNPKFILATGSSDGSVKLWFGDSERLINSAQVNGALFYILKEVITVASVPVSALSLAIPANAPDKVLLAVGKGSGSLEVWVFHTISNKFEDAGKYDAHDQVVTGLAWAFDGRCLYSCSQDNSMRSWMFHGSFLYAVPFPLSFPGLKTSADLPHVFDSCFGLAPSPGNLVVAVARSFDADALDPMYQARTLKAAVEFFWTGGQQLQVSPDMYSECSIEALPGFSERDLTCWESNILWSLHQFDHVAKPLIVWDVIAALSAFKKAAPNHVDQIFVKWFSSWLSGYHPGLSIDNILFHAPSLLSKTNSRHMHFLNILCRRLMLAEMKAEAILNNVHHELTGENDDHGLLKLWVDLLLSSERELRERLVLFTFSSVLYRASSTALSYPLEQPYWVPVGVAQMEQWVAINQNLVQGRLKILVSEVGHLGGRISAICEYITEEQCSFCSSPVRFESPEFALCEGASCNSEVCQSHNLSRCAVSMQVCPPIPLWFCVCCERRVSKLAPHAFFTMSGATLDVRYVPESSVSQAYPKPLCPFCGILLQRILPEFLLSASPV